VSKNWGNSYWKNERDFEVNLVIDFEPFKVEITRGKKKGSSYTVTPVFSWKRGRQVIKIGQGSQQRTSIGLTPHAKKWAAAAASQLRSQWIFRQPIPKTVNVTMRVLTYHPTGRLLDASNLYQGPEDILQTCRPKCPDNCKMHAGILSDDSQVENHNDSERLVDRNRPRVEITLKPWKKKR